MFEVREASETTDNMVPTLVVGVGASAGGLTAFTALLAEVPADAGLAFVLVQHLAPDDASMLPELLDAVTPMPVCEATQDMVVRPNTVIVIAPGYDLAVIDGRVDLRTSERVDGLRLPVDCLFRSLAAAYASRSVGVVLSGAGRDGSDGARHIRDAGGMVLAQSPRSAQQLGMPQSVIDAGIADMVLDIDEMPVALARFAQTSASDPRRPAGARVLDPLDEDDLRRLTARTEELVGFDLGNYKVGTVSRRVHRRMTLSGTTDINEYLEYLQDNDAEPPALVRDMLISVTEFFRDPEAFETLARLVVKQQVESATGTVRLWVAGCATGEEVYSLGMLYMEARAQLKDPPPLQIFASDIDIEALATARRGVYSSADLVNVSPERIETFFRPVDDDTYRVRAVLRGLISFAVHDLTKDPPFSRMHLISCRNVLIYLRPPMQAQVLRAFHFGLKGSGCLFLGSSESLSATRDDFNKTSKTWRIFEKRGASRPAGLFQTRRGADALMRETRPDANPLPRVVESARAALLTALVPPSVIVGGGDRVLYMHGELRPYLKFPSGEPRLDLGNVLCTDLLTRSRAALYKARRDRARVSVESSPNSQRPLRTRIVVDPLPALGDDVMLMSFHDIPGADLVAPGVALADTATVRALERELAATRGDLQMTAAQLEMTDEALRAVNEESIPMNEGLQAELQAANEELEAVSEELRSLNEELTTVNTQLRAKIDQVEQAHDDQTNFFSSTKIATMFLDSQLKVKRLTPAAIEMLRLDASFYGQFVGDINRPAMQHGLTDEARQVLDELQPVHSEITLETGQIFSRRVLPYLTEARRIEGVVVNYTDVTELRQTAVRLSRREQASAVIARLGLRALEEKELLGFLDQVVREARRILDVEYCKVLQLHPDGRTLILWAGVGWQPGLVRFASVDAGPESQAGYTLSCRTPVLVEDLRTEQRFRGAPLLTDHGVVGGVTCVIGEGDEPYGVLGAHCKSTRVFSDEDVNFLVAVASIVATAIRRHLTTLRLELESAFDRAVALASDLEEVMQRVTDTVDLGVAGLTELWVRGDATQRLHRQWSAVTGRLNASALEAAISGDADLMVDRVGRRRQAEWFTALQDPSDLSRATGLGSLGLAGGLAFPVITDGALLGVCVISGANSGFIDQALLRSLESMGRMIGSFVSRRASDAAVSRAEARIAATISNASVGIGEASTSGQWVRVNPKLCKILRRPAEQLIGQRFTDFVHPDEVGPGMDVVAELLQGRREPFSTEKRFIRGDDSIVWVHVTVSPVCDAQGEVMYFIDIMEDITERRAAEEARTESEQRLSRVLLDSPVPMLVFDERGHVSVLSRAWTQTFGHTIDDLPTVEHWIEDAFEGDTAVRVRALFGTSRGAEQVGIEVEGKTRGGERRIMRVRAADLGTGGAVSHVCAVIDVTSQSDASDVLVAADVQKDQFLAMLGHELRNPLAAIRTAATVLGAIEVDDPMVRRTYEVLDRQTNQMAALLDGLLDVSRIVRGKIGLNRTAVDMGTVLGEVLSTLDGRRQIAQLTVDSPVSTGECWVNGDRVRLCQVLDNLVSNAIKYTPPGGRIVCALRCEDAVVEFRVRDTGVGIAPALLPHVFEVFRQADQTLDRAPGGLGLGLALVKSLVELHGGSVQAISAGLGKGAEFVVQLPASAERPPAVDEQVRAAPAGVGRILVIEDNADVAQILGRLLAMKGHTVTLAADGAAGLAQLKTGQFDVVLCDIGLPGGMSGYDVAAVASNMPDPRPMLIALSGYGRPEDKLRSRKAGFDHHLTKPMNFRQLEGLLAEALRT